MLRIHHADWSVNPRKRWRNTLTIDRNGSRQLNAPQLVGDCAVWIDDLLTQATIGEQVLVGIDVPIGLPRIYDTEFNHRIFTDFIFELGYGTWSDFFTPTKTASEISLHQPFFPQSPKCVGVTRQALVDGLNVSSFDHLLRECDQATKDRGTAASLFWLVGAQQVGKAAITAWQEFIRAILEITEIPIKIWPFDGELNSLLHPGSIVICEAYPRQYYKTLGFPNHRWSKRSQEDRTNRFSEVQQLLKRYNISTHKELEEIGAQGFGQRHTGEDAFDCTVGVVGMAQCLLNESVYEPIKPYIRRTEGWIFGIPEPLK